VKRGFENSTAGGGGFEKGVIVGWYEVSM